jgi:hypothetical protein
MGGLTFCTLQANQCELFPPTGVSLAPRIGAALATTEKITEKHRWLWGGRGARTWEISSEVMTFGDLTSQQRGFKDQQRKTRTA